MRFLIRFMLTLPLLIALLLLGLFFYARHLERVSIFYPTKDVLYTPKDAGVDFEDIYFQTKDGVKLNAWFVPAPGAISTLLFFHGNGGNNGDRLDTIEFYRSFGLNVFIVDYRGYGKSEGSPDESGIYEDALAAYDYLVQKEKIDPQKIIVYGASLGGAPAIDLASKHPVGGIIVDSSFSSAVDMAKHMYPFIPSFLISVKLQSAEKIKKVTVPKLFIHSTRDEMIPYEIGRKLFEAAPDPKFFVTVSTMHNENREGEDAQKVTDAIWQFLKRYGFIDEK